MDFAVIDDLISDSRYLDAIMILKAWEKAKPCIAVYSALARCCLYCGLFKDGDFYARKRLSLLKEDTIEYVSALNQRANAFCGMGKYAESKCFTLKCIHMVKKMKAEETMEYAQVFLTASLVGVAYRNWDAALEGYLRAKEILHAIGPKVEGMRDYIEMFGTLTVGLGCCFQNMGRDGEALACFDLALSEIERLASTTHLSYATALHAFGSFYVVRDGIYLAIHLYEKAYNIYVKLLGRQHIMTTHLHKESKRLVYFIQDERCLFCKRVPYKCEEECRLQQWMIFKNDCLQCMVCKDTYAKLNKSYWGALYCDKDECKKFF